MRDHDLARLKRDFAPALSAGAVSALDEPKPFDGYRQRRKPALHRLASLSLLVSDKAGTFALGEGEPGEHQTASANLREPPATRANIGALASTSARATGGLTELPHRAIDADLVIGLPPIMG